MKLAGTVLWKDVAERCNFATDKGQSRRQRMAHELRRAISALGGTEHSAMVDHPLPMAFPWDSSPQGHTFWNLVRYGYFK